MARKQSQIGWRALAALTCSGAAIGFAVPAIAILLVHQEEQQPAVRLLPAPRLPRSETQPPPTYTSATPSAPPVPVPRPRGLTTHQLEQKARRAASRIQPLPTVKKESGPIAKETPPAPKPNSSEHKAAPSHTTPVGPEGGTSAPPVARASPK